MADMDLIAAAPVADSTPRSADPTSAAVPAGSGVAAPSAAQGDVRPRLARIVATAGQAGSALAEDDALRPARGIVAGLMLAAPFWMAVVSAALLLR